MNKFIQLLEKYNLITFIKFGITGLANTGIDFLVFWVLTGFFSVNIYVAQFLGYTCGMLNSYIVNRTWTFRSQEKLISPQLFRFIFTNLFILLLSLFILNWATEVLLLSKLLSKILVTVITLSVNFIISRLWVFKK